MNRAPFFLLYLNVLVVATCGLIYELLAGTLASYVLGDSVTQFSIVIGVYLSALGLGAWLSRFVEENLARCFVEVELGVALVGGASAPLLFFCFAYLSWFRVALLGIVLVIGTLVGLELPLLMRILKDHLDFRDLVSRVLAFDYIGRPGGVAVVPDFSGAAARSGQDVAGLRNAERRRRTLGNVSLAASPQTRGPFRPACAGRNRVWSITVGTLAGRPADDVGRRKYAAASDRLFRSRAPTSASC